MIPTSALPLVIGTRLIRFAAINLARWIKQHIGLRGYDRAGHVVRNTAFLDVMTLYVTRHQVPVGDYSLYFVSLHYHKAPHVFFKHQFGSINYIHLRICGHNIVRHDVLHFLHVSSSSVSTLGKYSF
jgi:hypothetical protein